MKVEKKCQFDVEKLKPNVNQTYLMDTANRSNIWKIVFKRSIPDAARQERGRVVLHRRVRLFGCRRWVLVSLSRSA
jgi:hypothetical protein